MACPQCHEEINGIDTKSYAVGWCQKDVHLDCALLHVRSCVNCRPHNEVVLYRLNEQMKKAV